MKLRNAVVVVMAVLLGGCAALKPYLDVLPVPDWLNPPSEESASVGIPARAVMHADALGAAAPTCIATAGKQCGGQYPDCCEPLVCPAMGPTRGRCTNEEPPDQGGTTPPATGKISAPFRPSYRDVGLKNKTGSQFERYQGHVATQTERDGMQRYLVDIAVPEALRYARTIPACVSSLKSAIEAISIVTARLGPGYEMRALCGSKPYIPGHSTGSWPVPINGRHYSQPNYALKDLQACSVSSAGASACALSPLMTPGLLDLLDMRIENAKCVVGASYTPIAPSEPYSATRAAEGEISTKIRAPILTAAQRDLMRNADDLHMAGTMAKCHLADPPPPGSATQAHLVLEGSARTEVEHHFVRMSDFGGTDATWTDGEKCTLALMEHDGHAKWGRGILEGDWCKVKAADNDHVAAHVCMALNDERLMVQPVCPADIHECKKLTCRQWMAQWRSQHPDMPTVPGPGAFERVLSFFHLLREPVQQPGSDRL